jgi:hypothetical protein
MAAKSLTPRLRRGVARALRWMDERTLTAHTPPHLVHYRALRRSAAERAGTGPR